MHISTVSIPRKAFLARLHFSAEELLLYPGVGVGVCVGVRMQIVRANVKVLEFLSFCIFLAF